MMNTMVYGNLALKPQTGRPVLTVVEGHAKHLIVAPERQIAAPDMYARVSPRVSSRSSIARAVVGIGLLAILVASFSFITSSMREAVRADAIANVERATVSVLPGESLWELAERHGIEGVRTADTVELIRSWNDLSSSMLRAGMELTVPLAG